MRAKELFEFHTVIDSIYSEEKTYSLCLFIFVIVALDSVTKKNGKKDSNTHVYNSPLTTEPLNELSLQ